jgi:predicted regulator of Ras-like GTPase activity (Roadblock/LC7/MglB family)
MSISAEATRADAPAGSQRQQRLEGALQALVAERGIVGAVLLSRDGIRVMDRWRRAVGNRETFSAMSATLMGAAEIALAELGAAQTRRVIAETATCTIVVVGAGEELLLVAQAEADVPLQELLPRVDAAAAQVAKVVAGG